MSDCFKGEKKEELPKNKDKQQLPEVYGKLEWKAVEEHIEKYFGPYDKVFHEIVSPDIHVDIFVSKPTRERDYYTLVTMGMGAHRMNVPKELKEKKLERAELVITLPPDWEIENNDEKWYWPLRWLKILARLPGDYDTWLGYGHTVPKGGPLAENTGLSGVMLACPYFFDKEARVCKMPDGDEINFYQIIPLYENEMDYKIENGADAMLNLFPDDFDMVVDINRENICDTR